MNTETSIGPSKSSGAPTYWFVVSLAYASYFALGLADNGRGPIFPDVLRAFALTDAQGGLFYFTASLAALANNLLLFRLMKKKGPYWTLQTYSAMQALGLSIIALSSTYPWVLFGCAVFGTSFGGLGIAHNVLVSDAAPPEKRRRLLAGLHAMYGIASLGIPLVVSLFYQIGLSFRAVIWLFAACPVLVLFASFSKRRREVMDAHRVTEATGLGDVEAADSPRFPRIHAFYYSLIFSFYVVAEIGLSSRLALFVRRDRGYDFEIANLLTAGFFAGLLAGRLLIAWVPLRISDRTVMALSLLFALVSFCLGLVHSPLWLAATGVMMSVFYPVGMNLVKQETGSNASTVVSWCITVQALWLMLMHLVMGGLSDAFGLGGALWIGPFCLVMALGLLLGGPKFMALSRREPVSFRDETLPKIQNW